MSPWMHFLQHIPHKKNPPFIKLTVIRTRKQRNSTNILREDLIKKMNVRSESKEDGERV